MATTILSSRELNQDTGRAKKAAAKGPVIITDRGRPTHVLLTIHEYELLKGHEPSIADLLYMPGAEHIELEIPTRTELARGADFS